MAGPGEVGPLSEPPRPGGEELTAFASGTFATVAPPSWYLAAVEAAETRGVDWPQAVSDATGCSDPRLFPLVGERAADLAIFCWLTPEGGRYVEIVDASACQLAVYVPDPADWPGFWADFVMPAMQVKVLAGLRRLLQGGRAPRGRRRSTRPR